MTHTVGCCCYGAARVTDAVRRRSPVVANVGVKLGLEEATKHNSTTEHNDISGMVVKLLRLAKANNPPSDPLHVDYANYVEYAEEFTREAEAEVAVAAAIETYRAGHKVVPLENG
ncbi:hypothetical protein Salat_2551300 [Sesamum alatum]|uniref:Uncharacterized protein n=1 Tax=Sesamum alatum TaxID=300844 RepID=A0AAE2CCP5_9LAMI|nr:hypothetical protein Salat_2551300 [Sesamum alatum]